MQQDNTKPHSARQTRKKYKNSIKLNYSTLSFSLLSGRSFSNLDDIVNFSPPKINNSTSAELKNLPIEKVFIFIFEFKFERRHF